MKRFCARKPRRPSKFCEKVGMAISKKESRLRRAQRGRAKIRELGVHRLSVHRTPRHIYVQVFAPQDSRVVASASTVDKELRASVKNGGNATAAAAVCKL